MISRFRVQNYKALRDITLDLTPVHALIGPNDSGKTSLLEAVAALGRSVDRPLEKAFLGSWDGRELVNAAGKGDTIRLAAAVDRPREEAQLGYSLTVRFPAKGRVAAGVRECFSVPPDSVLDGAGAPLPRYGAERYSGPAAVGEDINWPRGTPAIDDRPARAVLEEVRAALSGVTYLRWTARNLAIPAALSAERGGNIEASGFGLPTALDSVKDYDGVIFEKLQAQFRDIFPETRAIRLRAKSAFSSPVDPPDLTLQLRPDQGKGIEFSMEPHGTTMPASQASDGLLYVLGYLALLHSPDPPKILLIEEPENGIHPARLGEVIGILRKLVADRPGTQVILTTHSPYAVSHFDPEEVTHCRKIGGEVRVRRMDRYETVAEQIDLFTLGEIWTAEEDHGLKAEDHAAPAPPGEPDGDEPTDPAGAAG